MPRTIILTSLILSVVASTGMAQEPGWWGVVVAPESMRPQIESTPLIYRSYRPLHFYGNTIRRQYYRGTALPAPRDFLQGGTAVIRRR